MDEEWRISYIEDELRYQLSSTCSYEIIKNDCGIACLHLRHKYYDQAEFVLYRINTWNTKTPPVFVINTSDLTMKLQEELTRLQKHDPRMFENRY